MTTTKTANYTAEQTAQIVQGYANGETVEALAQALGKSVRSIVAKLSREGVYQKKAYKTKTGEAVVKKDSLADQIGMLLSMSEADVESLTKANKSALAKILDCVTEAKLSKNMVA